MASRSTRGSYSIGGRLGLIVFITAGIAIVFSTLGSYVSFSRPEWLSPNISTLLKKGEALLWSIISIIAITAGLVIFHQFKGYSYQSWEVYFLIFLYFIAAIDAYSGIIPDRLLILGIAGWAYLFFSKFEMDETLLYAGVAVGAILTLIRVGTQIAIGKPGFGWGDIKLMTVIGLFVGWDVLLVLYMAVLIGGIYGGIGMLTKKLDRTSKLRFAPFIFLGFIAEYVFKISTLIFG